MSYWYNVLWVQGIFCRYSPDLWCCCSSSFIVNYDISNVDYYSKSYSYQVYLQKNQWNIGKHSKVTTSASLARSVLFYKYFVMIPFFVWKFMKCQLFFGHKIMIGTVDSYTTLWHIFLNFTMLQKHFSWTGTLKGCLFSLTQLLMIFGHGKYYNGQLEINWWIKYTIHF